MMNAQVADLKVTPSALEVLLHYHGWAAPHPRHDAPAVVAARESFVMLGILKPVVYVNSRQRDCENPEPNHQYFATTERGAAWVKKLCETTCPELFPTPT